MLAKLEDLANAFPMDLSLGSPHHGKVEKVIDCFLVATRMSKTMYLLTPKHGDEAVEYLHY